MRNTLRKICYWAWNISGLLAVASIFMLDRFPTWALVTNGTILFLSWTGYVFLEKESN